MSTYRVVKFVRLVLSSPKHLLLHPKQLPHVKKVLQKVPHLSRH
jgi:hypothetical protein